MRARSSYGCGNHCTFWQVCVAVLLIGLVLYNPFLVLMNHSDGLAYQTLARNRATVGASEMQHYTPVQAENAQPEATAEEAATETVVEQDNYPAGIIREDVVARQPELIDSIWFRPPPSL